MGDPVTIGLLIAGTAMSVKSQMDAADEQRKAQGVQRAQNAASAAQERRQQIREERIKRAQILQSTSNTGITGGSGEAGAVGGISTNLSSNIAFNVGSLNNANAISIFEQKAADAMALASLGQTLSSAGSTMFSVNQASKK